MALFRRRSSYILLLLLTFLLDSFLGLFREEVLEILIELIGFLIHPFLAQGGHTVPFLPQKQLIDLLLALPHRSMILHFLLEGPSVLHVQVRRKVLLKIKLLLYFHPSFAFFSPRRILSTFQTFLHIHALVSLSDMRGLSL